MKSLKKTLVLLVVLSMILSAVSPVFAFSDVVAEEYAEQANKMAAFGVFTGDANGNFNAEENITRAEMAVVIGRLMGLTTNEANANQNYASNFSDVAAGDWYTGWVNLVAGKGIISGFPDGTFRPNEKVTQAQAVTMIVKALGWGVVVDQTGTWPANYITKAAELKLFKDAAKVEGELVTRGNVAIYCYNALTAKTWDVAESTGSELTSKASKENTILAKYFSEFTNEDGEMKLVEGLKVKATPINNNTLGTQQVVFEIVEDETAFDSTEYTTVAKFLEIEKPGKNKEEKTYEKDGDIYAYVLESACAELASLQGKYVDVIFGANNEVAYLAVTDEAENGLFVTAWDKADKEIELNGEAYEVATTATVSLFGSYVIETSTSYNAIEAIDDIIVSTLGMSNTTRRFTRNISASIVLNEDDEIKGIDFTASEHFAGLVPVKGTYLGMEQAIVEKISNTGKITTVNNVSKINGVKVEDLEDADVRVIKDNKIVTVDDIKVNDVLTLVITNDTASKSGAAIKTIFVSDAVVTGTLDKVKNDVLTIDGEEYNKVNELNGNTDGDIKEISKVTDLTNDYLGEEVEVYLNFMGEVAVIVSETESTPATIGIVTKVYEAEEDEDAEVEYLPVKILSAETGKATKYNIYHEDADKSVTAITNLAVGAVVWFSADAEGVIEYSATAADSDIRVVADKDLGNLVANAKYEVEGNDLEVVALTDLEVDESKNEVTVAGETYIFDDETTTYYNVCQVADAEGEIEMIKGWSALVTSDVSHVINETDIILVDGDEVVFFIGNVPTYATSSTEYAIVEDIDTRKENNKTKTFVTLDGKEYEVASIQSTVEDGDLVTYTLSNDKVTVVKAVDTWTVTTTEDDKPVTVLGTDYAYMGRLVVEKVDGRRVYFEEYEDDELDALYLVKTSVTVYDLENSTVEVVNIDELEEVIAGRHAVGTIADSDNDDIDTIIVF